MHLQNVTNARECEEANMKTKEHLYSLRLIWSREANDDIYDDAVILESLHPHKSLRELHISGYGDIKFPTWMSPEKISLLPNLASITIESCYQCQQLPAFGELPFLRLLKLYSFYMLEDIGHNSNSSSYFPSLKELVLFDLPLLRDWPRDSVVIERSKMTTEPLDIQQQRSMHRMQSFPCLTKLTIINCPRLTSLPVPPLLEELVTHNITVELQRSLVDVQVVNFSNLPDLKFSGV
ncbi:hypothetical protein ACH5RR_000802 [Cinchona calisaya]|uniref:R13L1/DRL21-like LRR repeat region domain-containing protein n=1 Tax=Cinchona calisaya TaxID=153742 RepID=A0ABD3B1V4_9GENT